ncbi:NUDCD3 [Symbiodinium natans]|uniref:Nuclear migration protein nudC n=1 Tax=Symbiodinium natans TaxID=878477 RepID=A0A812G710_9DINO|nr:NUDCD3 [Symbiodinium natans]
MDGRFDELLLGLAQKHKGIEDLLYTLMTFLERRTDFFHVKDGESDAKGFKEGEAEKLLKKQFCEFQARYLARSQPHLLAQPAQGQLGGYAAAASQASASRQQAPMGVNPSPLEGGDPGLWERHQNQGQGFSWNQTHQEVTVELGVEPCKAADLKVALLAKSVSIKRKGETILEGKLFDKISSEDSTWHLDSGKQVVLNLEKIRPAFWPGLFEGSGPGSS